MSQLNHLPRTGAVTGRQLRASGIVGLTVAAIALGLGIVLVDGGHFYFLARTESTLASILYWLEGRQDHDSWEPMQMAYNWLMSPDAGSLYQGIFFEQRIKFQYPPSSLLFYHLAKSIHWELSYRALNWISWAMVAVQSLAVGAITFVLARRHQAFGGTRWLQIICAMLSAGMCLTFYPVVRAYALGQVQVWLSAFFALACLCWLLDKRLLAGAFIGGICLFKPQFGLFLIWGLARRQWWFVLGWLAIVVPAELAALHLFGLQNHIDYLKVLGFISRHGETFHANQSINGMLNRLLENGDSLRWDAHGFAPYNRFVHYFSLLTSVAIVAWAVFPRVKFGSNDIIDLIRAGLAFTIASPISWEHHYGILPIAFAVLYVALIGMPPSSGKAWLCIAVFFSHLCAAHYWSLSLSLPAGWPSIFQSYLLFAALGVLWMLGVLSRHSAVLAREGVQISPVGPSRSREGVILGDLSPTFKT